MITAILIVFAVVIVLALVGMVHAALNGCFFASMWWCFGGATGLVELLAACVAGIVQGIFEG